MPHPNGAELTPDAGTAAGADGSAPGRPDGRFLAVRMVGHWHSRYEVWAWIGLSHLPRTVHQALGPEALAAVRRLRLVLLDRFTAPGTRLGSAEVEPVAAAVRACGEWWPMPEIGRLMVRDISGLDVPAVWGLEALRHHLRPEMVFTRDVLNDLDRSRSLAKTLAAAGDLLDQLRAAIGGPYAPDKPKPSAAKLIVAWRSFEAARARSGAITVLPLFGMKATVKR